MSATAVSGCETAKKSCEEIWAFGLSIRFAPVSAVRYWATAIIWPDPVASFGVALRTLKRSLVKVPALPGWYAARP